MVTFGHEESIKNMFSMHSWSLVFMVLMLNQLNCNSMRIVVHIYMVHITWVVHPTTEPWSCHKKINLFYTDEIKDPCL